MQIGKEDQHNLRKSTEAAVQEALKLLYKIRRASRGREYHPGEAAEYIKPKNTKKGEETPTTS